MIQKVLGLVCFLVILSSCATKKEIIYLQDAEAYNNSTVAIETPTIQVDDILQILITAFPNEPAVAYNRPVQNRNINQNNVVEGYLVSPDGIITIPVLGDVKAVDKTPIELRNHIVELLEEGNHLKNPVVEVRILNSKFTVLGEVNNPGTFTFFENNYSILQAIGEAGDLSINGKRDNILVIRQVKGERQVARLDLTTAELLDSPFFLVKPNDLIYVNPNGPKVKSAGYIGNLGTLLSVFSILLSTTLILTR